MHEVVYNNCYGGFGLSNDAIQWLEQNAKDTELKDYISKIRITCTRDAEIAYFIKDWFSKRRHHSDLVEVVKNLGNKVNDSFSELTIAEIKSDRYRIEAYDGLENVITPEETNWIVIKE